MGLAVLPSAPPTPSKALVRDTGLPGRTVTLDMIAVTRSSDR